MISKERVKDDFLTLVRTDSISGREGRAAAWLAEQLQSLGLEPVYDRAADALGGDCGNLIAHVPGPPDCSTILLTAHMDTVRPGEGVQPVLDGDVIRSDGTTVLGGDDKGGCVAILNALREVLESGLPHPPVCVVYTVSEETGLDGAKHLDVAGLSATMGFAVESGRLGRITTGAPFADKLSATIRGKRAHAGLRPEAGVNAILAASRGIAAMRLGRIDDETTANIGTIAGGDARNVVPETCHIEGGARSHDEAKLCAQVDHMVQCLRQAAYAENATAEVQTQRAYDGFRLSDDDPCVQLAVRAAERLGITTAVGMSGGGSDANILNSRGLPSVVIGVGPQEVHTTREWVDLNDLVGGARWIVEIIRLARGG
ncbi:MAG: M20/M25/M40 family metallo-hydrolase [Armatimonadota bacterium]